MLGRIFLRPIPIGTLNLFRQVFLSVFLLELIQMFYFRDLVFSRQDYMVFVLPAWMVVVGLMVIGWQIKWLAMINYILSAMFLSALTDYEYHIDHIYVLVHFLFIFIPWKEKYIPRFYHFLILFLAVGLTYLDSIQYKANSLMWTRGLGLWYPASFPFATFVDYTQLLNEKWLMLIMGYLTFAFEALFIFLFWFSSMRRPLLFLGCALHLGILLFFPIPLFALAMTAFYLLFLPIREPRGPKLPYTGNMKFLTAFAVAVVVAQALIVAGFTTIEPIGKRVLGVTRHNVFADFHFRTYNKMYGIKYSDSTGTGWLPTVGEDGHIGWYNTGRMWAKWTFRTNSYDRSLDEFKILMRPWLKFWIEKTGRAGHEVRFDVMSRALNTEIAWEKDRLAVSKKTPWVWEASLEVK